jgi:hypothetical protein
LVQFSMQMHRVGRYLERQGLHNGTGQIKFGQLAPSLLKPF